MSELTMCELQALARKAAQSMRCRPITPHPASARICSANVEWVKRFELVSGAVALQKVAAIRCGLLAAYSFHRMPELMYTAADLYAWLFLFDDLYVESSCETLEGMQLTFATYRDSIRTRKLPARCTPFHRAILDICGRCRAFAKDPACWSDEFSINLGKWFDGCIREQPYKRCSTETLRLDEYRRIGILTVGALPCFDLIPLGGASLSTNDLKHPMIARLQQSAAVMWRWANDIYSFAKENRDRDPMNVVKVLAHESGLSITAALCAAVDSYNAELASFENDSATLNGIGGMRNYVQALEDSVHGNLLWHALSDRYM